jgi:undecaprenyl-phosphate galactose phosphotransferase
MKTRSLKKIFLAAAAFTDLVIVNVSLWLAIVVRGVDTVHGPGWTEQMARDEFFSLLAISVGVTALFNAFGLYTYRKMRSLPDQIGILFSGIVYAVAGVSVIAFFIRTQWMIDSRLAILYFAGISITLLLIFHLLLLSPLYRFLVKKNILTRRVILIGEGPIADEIIGTLTGKAYEDIIVEGMVVDDPQTQRHSSIPLLGTYSELLTIISRHQIDEAIVTMSGSPTETLLSVIDLCRSAPVTTVMATPLMAVIYNKIAVETYFDTPVVVLRGRPSTQPYILMKQWIDVLIGIVLLVLLSVPMLLIALLVKATSNGPVLFRQVRIGKNGKPFTMVKFRTMVQRSLTAVDHQHSNIDAIPVGSRKSLAGKSITPVGKFLRRSSLDELPQLWNVLRGEMSLVGPRPPMENEYQHYNEWHKRRLSVQPGCTGLWQVTSRGEGDFQHMMMLDLYYINNSSLRFDLQLLLKTIPVMLFGKGGK